MTNLNEIEQQQEIKSKFSLFDFAKEQVINTKKEEKNLIIIGNKCSGKTGIFDSLTTIQANKDDYSETSGINFGFMRHQQSSSNKRLINIYEIGGGIDNLPLIKTLLNNQTYLETMIFIVLDFDRRKNALQSLIKYLKELEVIIKKQIDFEILQEIINLKEKKYVNKDQLGNINIFPSYVYVIGNKYDLLEKINAEKLKWVSKVLRYFCHSNALSLFYCSNRDNKLITFLQSIITDFAFEKSKIENLSRYVQKNAMRPIYIPFSTDTFIEIGDPKVMQMKGADMKTLWIESYQTLFQNEKDDNANDKNINTDSVILQEMNDRYKEPRIDNEKNIFDNNKDDNKKNGNINKNARGEITLNRKKKNN